MRTLAVNLIVLLLSLRTAIAQKSPAAQSYNDAGAYEIYSLLLPHEESYGFAKDALMIQENTVPEYISGACLRQTDANRFKGAIAGYDRIYKGKCSCSGNFRS